MAKKRKKGEEPVYHPQPLNQWTDAQLVRFANDVPNFFHERAEADRAQGDLFGGWDWPTMRMVYTELCDRYDAVLAEAKWRLETKDGMLNGQKYVKTDKGWKPVEA